MATSSTAPKRRQLRSSHSLPLENALSQHTTEAHNARHGVKEDVTMSLMNIGWRVRKNVTEGYKTGPSQAIPSAPPLSHSSSSFSTLSSGPRSSYTSSDAGSLRSTYTNPSLSTSAIFLSSSDALSSAKASVQQERERVRIEREQMALLNAMKPRRELMCLADIVEDGADSRENGIWQEGGHSRSPLLQGASGVEYAKADNYHLYLAAQTTHTSDPLEEEPYRLERGRKRQTVEEDEGEATETEDIAADDGEMDIDQLSSTLLTTSGRPIRPIKRNAGLHASSQAQSYLTPSADATVTQRNRQLRLTRSAPLDSLHLSFGEEQFHERMAISDINTVERLPGDLAEWVGRTDF
ncbi:hypothetical protein QFC19_001621 [Naganishia cerealis]|uniref:Uncharacterized protein n=1 Tax=Naganishia cerealis TaxID=610337 RepID=A0ACC2WGP0_9TREE|nr:hypothetical protein QFC19_001621 [Naganishia cerealis]